VRDNLFKERNMQEIQQETQQQTQQETQQETQQRRGRIVLGLSGSLPSARKKDEIC